MAAAELARVLRRGGRVGLSDLTHTGALPVELDGLLAWIACLGDAWPLDEYLAYLAGAGIAVNLVEPHDEAMAELVQLVRTGLLGAELLVMLKQLALPGTNFEQARVLARYAATAVRQGTLGYALVVASRAAT